MSPIRLFFAALVVCALLGVGVGVTTAKAAYDPFAGACSESTSTTKSAVACQANGSDPLNGTKGSSDGIFVKAERIIAFAAGVGAVVVVIISGLRFINANGDAQKVATARTSLLYALIGLVIIAVAHSIVVLIVKGVL